MSIVSNGLVGNSYRYSYCFRTCNKLKAMRKDLKIRGYTVAQFPNLPLGLALAGLVAGWILSSGSAAHALARAVFFVGLGIWAWLELSDGVNGFRRVLGAAGLAYTVVSLAGALD